jgi:hypothetical protein
MLLRLFFKASTEGSLIVLACSWLLYDPFSALGVVASSFGEA